MAFIATVQDLSLNRQAFHLWALPPTCASVGRGRCMHVSIGLLKGCWRDMLFVRTATYCRTVVYSSASQQDID